MEMYNGRKNEVARLEAKIRTGVLLPPIAMARKAKYEVRCQLVCEIIN